MKSWMDRLYAMELRTKLMLLFLLIAVIPLAVLGIFSYNKASSEIQTKAYEIILENLSQVNYSLNYFVQDIEQLSMYLYGNEEIQSILAKSASRSVSEKYEDQQTVNRILNSFLGFKSWDIQLYVLGENGDRYFTGDFMPSSYLHYNPDWGLFRKARLAGGDVVWDTHYSLRQFEDYGAVLSSGRLLKQIDSGRPLGYFVVDIMEPALADIYDKAHQYEGGEVYLLDSKGYIISSTPSKLAVGTRLDKSYLTVLLQGKKGFFGIEENGTKCVVIYDTSDTYGFKMISVVPVAALTGESASIRNLTIFIVIFGVLISYCTAYLLSDYITRPLRKLRRLMRQVEKGNLDVSFTSRYRDEVGHLGSTFNQMLHRIKYLISQVYEKQLKAQEAEIKAIQAQFTPHFLYNALDSINWMARIHRIEVISSIAVSLGSLLRFSIRRGNTVIPIREDFQQIRNYLTIQEIRFHDKITILLNVDDDVLDLYIPKLLIQPLVENAISHGLEMKAERGNLQISARLHEDTVLILVEDNGTGIEQDKLHSILSGRYEPGQTANTGIGLRNLIRRLELHFGSTYDLKIDSTPGQGTKVCLVIPAIRNAEEVQSYV
ncbi:cache domain-containing sensor histidine kinase [Paenibacillus medicaginis]|uniref:histidine kinase n=1 Tax=Paenibacillus medicaginis TaxID=1470560 RepID=A0ABV5C8T3_9BACL